jgi:hypothetical protein
MPLPGPGEAAWGLERHGILFADRRLLFLSINKWICFEILGNFIRLWPTSLL